MQSYLSTGQLCNTGQLSNTELFKAPQRCLKRRSVVKSTAMYIIEVSLGHSLSYEGRIIGCEKAAGIFAQAGTGS
jgi:hypothetical protein